MNLNHILATVILFQIVFCETQHENFVCTKIDACYVPNNNDSTTPTPDTVVPDHTNILNSICYVHSGILTRQKNDLF